MKVSEVTREILKNYLKLDELDTTDDTLIDGLLLSAKAFIRSYTGLTDLEIDTHEDITIVVMILVQDMYDNRTMYIEKNNLSKVVDTILGMHSVNLL